MEANPVMTDQRPNIIFIITDQQRFDTIRALGFPYMDTPNLDKLVEEGVSFDNCFITAPLCSPSRASLFSGYYPHTTGIHRNAALWRHSWVEQLNDAGYYCVNIGKMHTFPYETPLGFHERYVVENKDRYYEGRYYFDEWDKALAAQGMVKQRREWYRQHPDYPTCLGAFHWEMPEETHSDFFVGNMATWWLNARPKLEQPLFLQIGFPGPHPPYDPVPRYAEPYMERDLPLPTVTDEQIAQQPPPFQQMRIQNSQSDKDSLLHSLNPTRAQMQRQRAYYLANVTMIDEKVGEILATLDDKGYLDNAVVIFTSDHGDALCDYGHSQKMTMYDIITRVPTIIWSPGRFPGGRQVDQLCQLMDLGPTVLELAGVEPPENFEAISLVPALQDEAWDGRDYVFTEQPVQGGYMTMVRSDRWKLVHFLDQPYGQLFDLQTDPGEINNLWDDPAHAPVKQELIQVLCNWRIRSALQTADFAAECR